MAKLQLDKETWVAIPLFTLGAAITLGFVSGDLFGIDLGQALIARGGVEITISRVMSLIALGMVTINRDIDWGELGGLDLWVVYVTAGLIIAPPFFPIVADTIAATPYSIVTFLVQTMGITLASYIN